MQTGHDGGGFGRRSAALPRDAAKLLETSQWLHLNRVAAGVLGYKLNLVLSVHHHKRTGCVREQYVVLVFIKRQGVAQLLTHLHDVISSLNTEKIYTVNFLCQQWLRNSSRLIIQNIIQDQFHMFTRRNTIVMPMSDLLPLDCL